MATPYLAFSANVRQRVAQVEGLLEAAACLTLRFPAGVRILDVAIVVGPHPLGALLLGCLGLHFALGRAGPARHPAP